MNGVTVSDAETRQGPEADGAVSKTETIKLRFVNGVVQNLRSDSLADYLLAPVFLKFIAVAVAIIVLLHERPGIGTLVGVTKVFAWAAITAGTLLCFFIFGAICISLKNVGAIRAIYTPVITIPSILLTEYVTQVALLAFWGVPQMETDAFLVYVSRIGGVVILLDMLYGSHVAPSHPQTVAEVVPARTEMAESAAQGPRMPAPDTVSDTEMTEVRDPAANIRPHTKIRIKENIRPVTLSKPTILLGSERVAIDSIMSIRVEDHYLRVMTPQATLMVRGKLAGVTEQLDPELGLQVNRSTWVARTQMAYAERNREQGVRVVLQDGMAVLVARSRVPLVIDFVKRWSIELRSQR